MTMSERVLLLFIGCCFGFILGWIVRSLKYIHEDLEVIKHVNTDNNTVDNSPTTTTNDSGIIRRPILYDIVLFVIVVMVVIAAFRSQSASDNVKEAQHDQKVVTDCNKEFLTKTLAALNERTTFSKEQALANLNLQKSQASLLALASVQPPPTEAQNKKAFTSYVTSLTTYITTATKSLEKVAQNPFPTDEELQNCLDGK